MAYFNDCCRSRERAADDVVPDDRPRSEAEAAALSRGTPSPRQGTASQVTDSPRGKIADPSGERFVLHLSAAECAIAAIAALDPSHPAFARGDAPR
eukprot:gene17483-36235_t